MTLVDHLAQELQGSFHFILVLEHQGNTKDLLQHLADSPLVLGYQDNIHQELQGSFHPVLEPLGSSQGSTLLKELQDSYPEAQSLTQLDHFLLAQELPLGLTLMCLSQEFNQEEVMGCMGQVVLVHFPLLALFLHFLQEVFCQYHLDHGAHLQMEGSLLPQAPLVLAQGLWVHIVDLLLQEACW